MKYWPLTVIAHQPTNKLQIDYDEPTICKFYFISSFKFVYDVWVAREKKSS